MQRKRIAAVFALLIVLSSTPSFAIQRERRDPGDEGPIDRIIQLIEKIINPVVHAFDEVVVPHT